MQFAHPGHAGRPVRLAYCLNVHPAEDLELALAGIRSITLPLRDRLATGGEAFGVGLHFPAALAGRLAAPEGERDLARLEDLVARERLDPFTFNAFPAGGFHAGGLKAGVFRPSWMEEERLRFTLDVAAIAARLARASGSPRSHVSISTHSGCFGADLRGEADERAIARNLARAVEGLSRIEGRTGVRILLALEAEPRASCGDSAALSGFLDRARGLGASGLATCLDACHSAVEHEDPREAFLLATRAGPLGKLQFSSALVLRDAAGNERGRARLLALDEPRYLHQVTGVGHAGRCEAADLPEVSAALRDPAARERWLACREWRCHFHVPVDLETVGEEGLATTRAHADAVLDAALDDPASWGVGELHVEIETYTWSVLPGEARGSGGLVDGLEREYRHVLGRLERRGWQRR